MNHFKNNTARLLYLFFVLLLLGGCGGGGGGTGQNSGQSSFDPGTSTPPPTSSFTDVLFQFTLLPRAVPGYIDTIRFSGLNALNDVVYGPQTRNKSRTITLSNVPLEVNAFRIEFLQNGAVRGLVVVQVQLEAGKPFEIFDPPFNDVEKVVDSLEAEPSRVSLPVGLSTPISVLALLNTGEQQEVAPSASWTVQPPGLASVAEDGVVTANSQGSGVISASYGGRRVEIPLSVTEAVLQNLVVSPPTVSLPSGLSTQLSVEGFFSDGTRFPITNGLNFSSLNPTLTSVDESGLVTALNPGSGEILVEYNGVSRKVSIEVTDAVLQTVELVTPSTLPLGALGKARCYAVLSDNRRIEVTDQANWTSSTVNVTVTNSEEKGLLKAVTQGQSIITCTYQNSSASAPIEVTPAEVASLELNPPSLSLPVGLWKCVEVTARYTDGTTVPVKRAVWTSGQSGVAEASSSGQIVIKSPGATDIAVEWGGKKATLPVTGQNKRLESLSLEPNETNLIAGLDRNFTALGQFDDGGTLDVSDCVFWTLDFPELAHVSTTGLLSSLKRGVVTLRAYSPLGVSTDILVNITEEDLVEMYVEGPEKALPVGVLFPIRVSGLFTDGTTRDLTRYVQRHHSRGDLIGFELGDASHVMRTKAPGTVELTILFLGPYWAGVPATEEIITVEIEEIPLQRLEISPPNIALPFFISQNYTLLGFYEDGSQWDLTHDAAWQVTGASSAYMIGERLRPPSPSTEDSGTITATHNLTGRTTQTTFQYDRAFVERVDIVKDSLSIPVGRSERLESFAYYSNGYIEALNNGGGWSSTDNGIATLSSDGSLRAVGEGQATVTLTRFGEGGAGAPITDTITIDVTSAVLQDIRVEPENVRIARGVNYRLNCVGTFTDGTEHDITDQVEWRSLDEKVATFSEAEKGVLLCENFGPVVVEAYSAALNLRRRVSLTIDDVPIVSLHFDDGPNRMRVGMKRRFKVFGKTAQGELYDLSRAVEWTTSNPSVTQLSDQPGGQGLLSSLSLGTTTLQARLTQHNLTASQSVEVASSLKRLEFDIGDVIQLHCTAQGDRVFARLQKEFISFDTETFQRLGSAALVFSGKMDVTSDGNTALIPSITSELIQVVNTQTFEIADLFLPVNHRPRAIVIGPLGWAYCATTELLLPIRMSDLQVFEPEGTPVYSAGAPLEWIPGTNTFFTFSSDLSRMAANGPQITLEQRSSTDRAGDNLSVHPQGKRFLAISSSRFPGPYDNQRSRWAQGMVSDLNRQAKPLDTKEFGELRYSTDGTVIYSVPRNGNYHDFHVYCSETGERLMTIPLESTRIRASGKTFAVSADGRELYIHTDDVSKRDGTALEVYRIRL